VFSGKVSGMSVNSFLQSRVARGVSTHELLVSAVDLLEGPALIWYRSVHSTVQSWEIVCPVDSARIFAV
jgi:hypothetical protein